MLVVQRIKGACDGGRLYWKFTTADRCNQARNSHWHAAPFLEMRLAALVSLLLPLAARGADIVLSNDDGWAEINIRMLYSALADAGDAVVLSAPAVNMSGSGVHAP